MSSSSFSNISLYIPHVFANISKKVVADTFDNLRIGNVKRVDFVHKRNASGEYNAVYIHFNYWHDNVAARNFQERVLNPNMEARIVYDEPWYWVVLANKAQKADSTKRKPRLDVEALSNIGDVTPVEKMMTNEDFANLFTNSSNEDLEDFNAMCKDTCYAQEDAAIITQDDLVEENRKLREQLGEYMEKVGRLEHEYNMLMDEKLCLNNEVVWLREMNMEHGGF
jgi:hypothetical protein